MGDLRSESVRAIFALAILRAFKRFNGSLTLGKLIKYHQLARPEHWTSHTLRQSTSKGLSNGEVTNIGIRLAKKVAFLHHRL